MPITVRELSGSSARRVPRRETRPRTRSMQGSFDGSDTPVSEPTPLSAARQPADLSRGSPPREQRKEVLDALKTCLNRVESWRQRLPQIARLVVTHLPSELSVFRLQ